MILDLIYPKVCQYCQILMEENQIFCASCLEKLSLIPSIGRCQKCFQEISLNFGVCKPCRKRRHSLKTVAGCFEHFGPAVSMIHALKKGRFYLAKDMAAFMVLQIDRLGWPLPDCIVSVPRRATKLLATELSKMLGKLCCFVLRRKIGSYPSEFFLKKKCNISHQIVLLVDLQMKSRRTLNAAAKALREQPCTIYGLSFTLF